jgi:hypothetical protein
VAVVGAAPTILPRWSVASRPVQRGRDDPPIHKCGEQGRESLTACIIPNNLHLLSVLVGYYHTECDRVTCIHEHIICSYYIASPVRSDREPRHWASCASPSATVWMAADRSCLVHCRRAKYHVQDVSIIRSDPIEKLYSDSAQKVLRQRSGFRYATVRRYRTSSFRRMVPHIVMLLRRDPMPEDDVLVVGGSVIGLRATLDASEAPHEASRLGHVRPPFSCKSEGTLALRRLKRGTSRAVPRLI